MRFLAILSLVACSDSPAGSADAAPTLDAYDTARCLIQGDYGALGSLTGTAAMASGATTVTITLDPGPPRDTFFVKLVPGNGVFASGLAAGTYTISGVDAGYATCGLCVHVIADIVSGVGPSKFYFADAGTVTLTTVTAPIMGSAQDLHLAEVDINSGQKIAGGCQASITSVMFATQ